MGSYIGHYAVGLPGQLMVDRSQTCIRRVASLEGGVEAFLARRSSKFRAELAQRERCLDNGRVDCRDGMETLVNVWSPSSMKLKGMSDQGVDHGLPLQFYREIMASLLRKGTFRGVFIRNDTEDLSFAFGGIEGTLFRGLQLSYRCINT